MNRATKWRSLPICALAGLMLFGLLEASREGTDLYVIALFIGIFAAGFYLGGLAVIDIIVDNEAQEKAGKDGR